MKKNEFKGESSKVQEREVTPEVKSKVTAYVYANYTNLKDLPLTIRENDNCFYVYKHKDGGPMILGKGIIS